MAHYMTEIDYKRAYYCLKKWIEEIQEQDMEGQPTAILHWIKLTCENKIFNGEYLDDKEYNEMIKEDDKKRSVL